MKLNLLFKLLLLIIIFLLEGCSSDYSRETKKLNTILSKYNKTIPQKHHLFFVRSKFYCNGCIQLTYHKMDSMFQKNDETQITIISYDKKYIPKRLLLKVVFIQDTFDITDKMFPRFANITVFETNDRKVVNLKNISDSRNIKLPDFVKNND